MVDTIKFSQMPNAGDINNNDIMPSLRSGENVILTNPWTFLPPGTTAQRPTPSSTINYRLRFNTDEQLYEYYDAVLGAWTQLQESAFTVGPFITYTADISLPDAQNLGLLANGILKQTIALGVAALDIAVNGTDYYGPGFVIPGTSGGTGVNNGVRTINLGSPTTGYVLTSDASGNATWQAVSISGAITTINGDSGSTTPALGVVTINGGTTGLTTTGSGSTLSLGGLLNSTFGGLGVSNPTAHGILIGEGASPVTPIVLSSGQILIGSTGADPVAAAINSGTGILVANSAGSITVSLAPIATLNILSNITGVSAAPIANTLTATIDAAIGSTQGNVLYRNGTVWTVLTPGTNGQFLTSGGPAANVSWSSQVAPTGQALTEVNDTNVTMTLGGSPTVALLAATSLTLGWTGQLSITRGGTGVSSVTTAPAATAWAGWDANLNLSANNFIAGYTTTATAAGNTTLTVGSTSSQFFTGVTIQTVTMPVASTLVTGHHFYVVNNSSGAVTINSSGGNAIQVMAAGTTCNLTCILNSGTSAASWYAEYAFQSGSSTGTVNSGSINQVAWYAANGTAVSGLPTANNGVLVTSAGGVPSISSTLPAAVITNIAGRYLGTTIYTSGTNTFTPNAATNTCIVTVIGGGGGGGGVAGGGGGTVGGGGGGSGAIASAILTRSQMIGAGTTTQAVVGALGAGGTSGANTGSTGGTSTLKDNGGAGATLISSTGGSGGVGGTVSVTAQVIGGGAAGGATISTGTQLFISGQLGFEGLSFGTVANGISGRGGSTPYGSGAGGSVTSGGAGVVASGSGCGGGGAFSSTASSFAGGDGTAGIIRIDEYS
jgi:hypothetical protein